MSKSGLLPQLLLLSIAWLVMIIGAYFTSWTLLPDLTLLVILALQFYCSKKISWLVVLPFSILADVGAALPLGFHGVYYSLLVFIFIPLGLLWSMVSMLAQFALVLFGAAILVLLKWLMIYVVTGEPVATGWWLTVVSDMVCWPLVIYLINVVLPTEVKDEAV